jgi:hypothetical protein
VPRILVDFVKAVHRSVPPQWAGFLDALAKAMQNPMTLPPLPPLPPDAAALAEALRQPPPWPPAVRDGALRAVKQLLANPAAATKPPGTKERHQRAFNAWVASFADPGPSIQQCYDWGRAQQPAIAEGKVRDLRARCPDQRLRKRGRKSDGN